MRKTDRLVPVITVVVYYGERPWDGAVTLHEMLDMPKEVEQYVNDYRIVLVEARKNELAFHNENNIDLFHLLEIILDKSLPGNEIRKRAIQYSEKRKPDKSVVMAVAGATNTKIDYSAFEKGDGRVCTLFEEIAKESENKGREEGREEGRAEGIIKMGLRFQFSENGILDALQNELGVPLAEAQEYFRRFGKQVM